MQILKKIFQLVLLGALAIFFAGCHKTENNLNEIKVGTIAGPETDVMKTAKDVAEKKYGLQVKIVEFTDFNMPNEALKEGSIDANAFQHEPYLKEAIQKQNYKFAVVGKTFIYPLAIYSKKIKTLKDLKTGAIVAIPNDPSNEARSLLLLQSAGLIKLKAGDSTLATPSDIAENPLRLNIKPIDASQLPRTLADVDVAVINTTYAVSADLSPKKDGLFVESVQSPYTNLIVVRTESEKDPRVQHLVAAFQSDEVIEKAKELFKDQAIPAWK